MADGSVTIDTNLTTKNFEIGIKKLENIGKKGLGVVTAASGAAIAGLTALGGYAIKVGSSFEAGMSKVQAISGATNEELTALTDKAKEMGAKTKFSATESAEAFQYMAMAGWKTGDMLNGIEGIMNLAAASGEELASVSDIVTDALTAFGLQASDSAHFADVLAKASSNSNTNVGLMGETFKYVAPLAGSMGYSIEDTAVAIGLMANAGIKGSQAGTALRSTMTRLVKPPKDAAIALKKLGISATNSDGTMKPLSQTIGELREKFSKLDESQKASYAASIAGQEAMSGLLAIVNASESDYDKLVKSINNADGAAKEMADTMNDNLAGATTIMKSTIESFGIAIYDKFCEPAKKGVKDVTKVFESLKKQIENGKLSKSIDKIADGFGKLITKAGDLTAKALPKAIDLLSWIVDHGGSIAKVIGTIAGSMAFLKTTALLSGPILSWQNAVKVLKTLESGSKNVTVAQAAMNGMLSLGQIGVGVLTGKISLATAAQKLWNTAISANPVGVFVGALVGLGAAIKVIDDKLSENEKTVQNAFETMGASASDFSAGIDVAKSRLSEFNSELFVSSEEQQKLQDEMQAVQNGITSICKVATEERRDYTQAEIEQLDAYFEKLRSLNQRELEIQKQISTAICQQAVTNSETFQGSLEDYKKQSEEWLSTAEDQKNKTIELINSQTTEEIVLLNQRYGEQANMQNEAYATEFNGIIAAKEAKIKETENEVNTITGVYAQGYADRAVKEDEHFNILKEYKAKQEKLDESHIEKVRQIKDGELWYVTNTYAALESEDKTYAFHQKETWAEMYKNMSESQLNELGVWMQKLAQTELYGGKISDENQEMVDTILASYDAMPPETQEAMKNAMEPMLTEMQNKEPELFKEATNTADGVLSALKDKFEIHSPSRATRRIFQNVMSPMLDEMQSMEPSLFAKAASIAQGILSRLRKAFDIHSPSRKTREIFKNVMLGGEVGLEKEEDNLYKQIQRITKNSKGLFEKMQSSVNFETQKMSANISATAMLKASKDQVRTVNNNNGNTINNTQNFYDKQASPYEQQKQSKQQLRRLAYEL